MEWNGGNIEEGVGRVFEQAGFVPVRRGWPDYAIFRRDGTLKMLVEVKSPGDTVRFEQHLIHDMLRAAGIEVRVVRLEDMAALVEELRTGATVTEPSPSKGKLVHYCADASCPNVLRHPRHRRLKPTRDDVAAAALRRSEMMRHNQAEGTPS